MKERQGGCKSAGLKRANLLFLSGIFHYAQAGDLEVGKKQQQQKNKTLCPTGTPSAEWAASPPTTGLKSWQRCPNDDELFSFTNRLRFQQLAKTPRACLPRRAAATRSICANKVGRCAIKPVTTRLGGCWLHFPIAGGQIALAETNGTGTTDSQFGFLGWGQYVYLPYGKRVYSCLTDIPHGLTNKI